MLWMLFCSSLALMTFRQQTILFLVLFCFISVEISEIQLVCDGWTNGLTDGQTDLPSYRDARTHLKMQLKIQFFRHLFEETSRGTVYDCVEGCFNRELHVQIKPIYPLPLMIIFVQKIEIYGNFVILMCKGKSQPST